MVSLESPLGNMAHFSKHDAMPSPSGFITRFNNYINKLPASIEEMESEIAQGKRDVASLRERAAQPFEKGAELDAARGAYRRVQRQLVAKGPEVPAEQKPLLEAALQRQRERLVKHGFGEALRVFSGMAEKKQEQGQGQVTEPAKPVEPKPVNRIAEQYSFGLWKLEEYGQLLSRDSRYDQHTGTELAKAAFWRGVSERKQTDEGKTPDFARIDAVLADRAALAKLPDVDGIEGMEIQRKQGRGQRSDDGQEI